MRKLNSEGRHTEENIAQACIRLFGSICSSPLEKENARQRGGLQVTVDELIFFSAHHNSPANVYVGIIRIILFPVNH